MQVLSDSFSGEMRGVFCRGRSGANVKRNEATGAGKGGAERKAGIAVMNAGLMSAAAEKAGAGVRVRSRLAGKKMALRAKFK